MPARIEVSTRYDHHQRRNLVVTATAGATGRTFGGACSKSLGRTCSKKSGTGTTPLKLRKLVAAPGDGARQGTLGHEDGTPHVVAQGVVQALAQLAVIQEQRPEGRHDRQGGLSHRDDVL